MTEIEKPPGLDDLAARVAAEDPTFGPAIVKGRGHGGKVEQAKTIADVLKDELNTLLTLFGLGEKEPPSSGRS